MSYIVPAIPDNAPFSAPQRAWLNGLIAAFWSEEPSESPLAADAGLAALAPPPAAAVSAAEDFPWHDPTLGIGERQALAAGRPLPLQLMAAMAQLDCGQCGYLCRTYAEAIAGGVETSLSRCVPGGKETSRVLKELMVGGAAAAPTTVAASAATPAAAPASWATAAAYFESAARLNREGSAKDTRHVVLALADGALEYRVGDALGVRVTNDPEVVEAIIGRLATNAGIDVDCPDGTRRSLQAALLEVCDIGRPSDLAIEVLASRARDQGEADRLQMLAEGYPGAEPADADLLDLLLAFPSARPPVQELILALGELQPRLYSIASSPKAAAGQVHLTVAAVRYRRRGRLRKGVASTYLAERAGPGVPVPVFVQRAHGFALPEKADTPIVMIGPGTGVAPFRAFLQERRAIGARGRNWLFFGDQRRDCDFLYQDELLGYRRDGLLANLDLAFSRDQDEKVYVQHHMRQRAGELWAWLQDGAHLYVCGDATRMARDVDTALTHIIAKQGRMEFAAAKAYLANLARDRRYQRDVY